MPFLLGFKIGSLEPDLFRSPELLSLTLDLFVPKHLGLEKDRRGTR